jgi:hypothetical protein
VIITAVPAVAAATGGAGASASHVAAAASSYRMAVLSNKVVSIYTTDRQVGNTGNSGGGSVSNGWTAAVLTAQFSLTNVKLVYWTFIAVDIIFIITHTSGYTVKVTGPNSNASAFKPLPVKRFERIDLEDPTRFVLLFCCVVLYCLFVCLFINLLFVFSVFLMVFFFAW